MKLVTTLGAILICLSVALASTKNSNADTASEAPPNVTEFDTPQIYCLALNIYHESRSSNLADMAAVADVVMNRVKDKRYPGTICEVVKQGQISKWYKDQKNKEVPLKNRCQFSWFCDGKSDEPKNKDSWEQAKLIAYQMVRHGRYIGISEGATHYHATYVNPNWASSFTLIGRIGEHIFYRAD